MAKRANKTRKSKKEEKLMTDEVEEIYGDWCSDPENYTDEACEKLF
jgi:hypothetical protein